MPVRRKRLSKPRGAGAPAHTYRSEPKDLPLDSHTLPPSQNETIVISIRKPVPWPHAARAVERAQERDVIVDRHFDLTFQVGRVGWLVCCC